MRTSAPPAHPRRRRPPGWGRALSARRVAHIVTVGQHWQDRTGVVWEVEQVHRKDRAVRLEFTAPEAPSPFRYVTFTELGAHYREAS